MKTPKKSSESEVHNITIGQDPEKCTMENCDLDDLPKEVSNNILTKNNITEKQEVRRN